MKKLLLSFFVISAFVVYALHERGEDAQAVLAVQKLQPTPTTIITDTPTPTIAGSSPTPNVAWPTSTTTVSPTPIPGKYKNGSYTGDSVDAFYGIVQVAVTINGGKISDVQFLQFPNDRQTSQQVSAMSLPLLKQEAIQVQSARVDVVTGATQTSEGFQKSLDSALEKAQI